MLTTIGAILITIGTAILSLLVVVGTFLVILVQEIGLLACQIYTTVSPIVIEISQKIVTLFA